MCGRFTLLKTWAELVALYQISPTLPPPTLPPRSNIAPSEDVLIVRRQDDSDARIAVPVRWGLVPTWAKDIGIGTKMINARAETVEVKPAFRQAFRKRRCLIPADGFYEWQVTAARRKQPHHITLADDRPFAFAGLWERWTTPEGGTLESCTIIVTEANAALAPIHHRIPVILEPHQFTSWLDPVAPVPALKAMLAPYDGSMVTTPVHGAANRVANDGPACLEPAMADLFDAGRHQKS